MAACCVEVRAYCTAMTATTPLTASRSGVPWYRTKCNFALRDRDALPQQILVKQCDSSGKRAAQRRILLLGRRDGHGQTPREIADERGDGQRGSELAAIWSHRLPLWHEFWARSTVR